jgi:hypothetical protein
MRIAPAMRRLGWGLGLLLVLLTAGRGLSSPPRPASCKPSAPIDLDATLVGDPSAPSGVVAHASSRTEREVELEIVLPEGVTHVAGDRKLKGRRCDARVDLRAQGRTRGQVLVRASISEGGAILTRVVALPLSEKPEPPRGTIKKNARGEAILELTP